MGDFEGAPVAVKRKSWIPPSAAAKYFCVGHSTVREWISNGRLRAARLPTGHYRILARDVIKCLLELGKPIPAELGDLSHKHVLIVDPDLTAANTLASVLAVSSGCKVSVAETAPDARGLLNGMRPDLVVLGVRRGVPGNANGSRPDMLILAHREESPGGVSENGQELSLNVSEILPALIGHEFFASRVAHALLG